jgi:hypothetical protein
MKHRKLFEEISRNIFILGAVLLLLEVLGILFVSKFVNMKILEGVAVFFGFAWLFFYDKSDLFEKKLEVLCKYLFLAGLILITLGSLKLGGGFLSFLGFLKGLQFHLVLFTIGFGFFTFYFNKDRVEKEIESEKNQE